MSISLSLFVTFDKQHRLSEPVVSPRRHGNWTVLRAASGTKCDSGQNTLNNVDSLSALPTLPVIHKIIHIRSQEPREC